MMRARDGAGGDTWARGFEVARVDEAGLNPRMAKKLQVLLGQFGQITAQLREVMEMEASQVVMDSCVLRFELAYEVMCKTLQAHATWQGKLVQSPRESLKHGFRTGLITDWDMAEEMISDRNVLIHTYDLEAARRVYSKLPAYLNFIQQALTGLQKDLS